MRLENREMKVRKKVRGNIGNNVLAVVGIKFSISSRKHKDTHNHTHLQLSPSGWDCVIWHIHFLGRVCLRHCRGSRNPHRGIPANPWMMSLSKHTCRTANKSRLWKSVSLITAPPFPPSSCGNSCHSKFGLISSSLQVTECRRGLTPFFSSCCTAPPQFLWSSPLVRHLIMWLFTVPCIPNCVPEATRSAPANTRWHLLCFNSIWENYMAKNKFPSHDISSLW